jgi:hypothetical protein
VLLGVAGTSFDQSAAQLSCPSLSLSSDPALREQARRLYSQSGGGTPPKVSKTAGRLLLFRCGGIEV